MKISIVLFGMVGLAATIFAAEPATPEPAAQHFKIIQTTRATYPARMMNEGVSHGTAKAVLHVDSQGQLVDFLVVAYTRQAFAEEAERVIKKWKFEPGYVDGKPIDTIMDITFNFEVNGVMLVQKFITEVPWVDFGTGFEYQACGLKNLDRIPTPVSVVTPTYPREWAEKGISGRVVVDFYIDETGKVRFVGAQSSANELLAAIAVAAVDKWQFAPPTRKGSPVLVHAQQIFVFNKEMEDRK